MMIIKNIAVVFCAMSIVSCNKDFLQRDPGVAQDKEEVFSNPTLAARFADRSYVFLTNDYGRLGGGGQPFRGSIAEFTDEAVSGSRENSIVTMNAGDWLEPTLATDVTATTNTSRGLPPYVRVYQGVRNVNVFLEQFEKIPWANDPLLNKDLVKAQQLFLRAMLYYEFARRWGGAVLLSKPLNLQDELDLPRSTFEETMAFIEKDLNEAEQIFSTVTFQTASGLIYSPERGWDPAYEVNVGTGVVSGEVSGNYGRATLGAVRALRSRALLLAASPLWNSSNNTAKWKAAADASKKVMDMQRYTLQASYRTVLEVATSPEYIMAYVRGPRLSSALNFFSAYVMSPGSGGSRNGLNPTQNHVDLYEMSDGRRIGDPGSRYTLSNPYANRDPRLQANILYNTHPWQPTRARPNIETWYTPSTGGGATTYGVDAGADNTLYTATGYYCRKMWPEELQVGRNTTALLNYVYFRYGEILLNYAEAINEAGDPASAVPAVNQVRARAGMPNVATTFANRGVALSRTSMRDLIRNERAVELAFEDVRWWDILRWKKGKEIVAQPIYRMDVKRTGTTGANFVYTLTLMSDLFKRRFEEYMHLYPIPRGEIVKSNGKLLQNPGWPTN